MTIEIELDGPSSAAVAAGRTPAALTSALGRYASSFQPRGAQPSAGPPTRWYVEASGDDAHETARRLAAVPGVVAAYVKPADELPM